MKRIAYQGIEGCYSHITAQRVFKEEAKLIGYPSFQETFDSVEKGEADFALMAIENTLIGPIVEVLDLIVKGNLKIIGETDTQIEHSLLALPQTEITEIQTVFSHPKALAQCTAFFKKHKTLMPEPFWDTAGAAKEVAKKKERSLAAIAHASAGPIYGLQVLLKGIEDHRENYTRFLLLSKSGKKGKKETFFVTLEHRPGSLGKLLTALSSFGNVTQLVTRPLLGRPYEYGFYFDIEVTREGVEEELKTKCKTVQFLGAYNHVE